MPRKKPSHSPVAKLHTDELRLELARRQRAANVLVRRRARMAAKLQELDSQIAALGVAGAPGVRARNGTTLSGALQAALKGKTLSVSQAIDAVTRSGYVSGARNFRTMVNGTLIRDGAFKRVGRGMYTAK